jgi:hypothetical protein
VKFLDHATELAPSLEKMCGVRGQVNPRHHLRERGRKRGAGDLSCIHEREIDGKE